MKERVIRVKGKGTVSMSPDCIEIEINLSEKYITYEQSMEAAAESLEEIRKALKPLGFDKKDIKTTKFNINSKFDSKRNKAGDYVRYFVGYIYTNELSIEFDNDNKKLGKVLYALSKCGSKPEFSIKYKMKDYSNMKELLLERSVADAKKKALIISKAAGVTLGEIINIDYSWSDINIYHEDNVLYESMSCCESSIETIDLQAEDLSTSDTVTVVWEIV
jgi:uncharacterized protein YggE